MSWDLDLGSAPAWGFVLRLRAEGTALGWGSGGCSSPASAKADYGNLVKALYLCPSVSP